MTSTPKLAVSTPAIKDVMKCDSSAILNRIYNIVFTTCLGLPLTFRPLFTPKLFNKLSLASVV